MISIIICTYNRAGMLSQVLTSLNQQKVTPGMNVEILIVDNNSKDETKQVAETFSQSSLFPARYIFEQQQGLSFARNTGIKNAQGNVIAFLDDDIVVDSGWVAAVDRCFKETDAVMMGGKIFQKWDFEPPSWYTKEMAGALIGQDYGAVRTNRFETGRYLLGANMAFRKEIFTKIGLFHTGLGRKGSSLIGGEDRDIFERIQKAGGTIWYDPAAIITHPVEKNRVTQSYMKKWFYEIGRTRGYQMEWQPVHYLSILPLWEWKDFWKSLERFFFSAWKKESEKFSSHLWLLHHWGIFVERILSWLPFGIGRSFSLFKEK